MKTHFAIIAVLGALAIWMGVSASDAREMWVAIEGNNRLVEQELAQLKEKRAALEGVAPGALRNAPDALSHFYSRMLEAGEVLGAHVRIEARTADFGRVGLQFEDPGNGMVGLAVCRLRLQAAIEGDEAIPVLAMMEEQLAELPVAVRTVTARRSGRDLALAMEVDIFGRTQ